MAGQASSPFWSLSDGRAVVKESLPMTVSGLVFSPDGQWLATACNDETSLPGEVRLWNAQVWQPIGQPLRHTDGVSCLAFGLDSQIVTGTDNGHLRLWDGHTGAARGELARRLGGIGKLAVSPNGRWLAASFNYRQVQVWNLATREVLMPPILVQSALEVLGFAPDGRYLLTSAGDCASLWNLSPATNRLADLESTITRLAGVHVVRGALVPLTAAELAGQPQAP